MRQTISRIATIAAMFKFKNLMKVHDLNDEMGKEKAKQHIAHIILTIDEDKQVKRNMKRILKDRSRVIKVTPVSPAEIFNRRCEAVLVPIKDWKF